MPSLEQHCIAVFIALAYHFVQLPSYNLYPTWHRTRSNCMLLFRHTGASNDSDTCNFTGN